VDGLATALPPAEARVLRAFLLVLAALAAGIAGGWVLFERDEGQATAGWNRCVNPVEDFSIEFPAAWYTHHPEPKDACTYFDPRPFELEPEADWGPKALQVTPVEGSRFEDDDFEETASAVADERMVKVLEREELELAGHRALRLHTEVTSGTEFSPTGTRSYLYVIDGDGFALVVRTTATAGTDYAAWRDIVDRAARSVRFVDSTEPAVEGGEIAPPQLGLPESVARKRAEIWSAATARPRNYATLAAHADPKDFEYTFGGPVPGGPAAYWRRIERTTTERPIDVLAAILELPYVYQPESRLYVWPYAFTRNATTLTIDEKGELADAIGEDALRLYEQSDNYLGYRAAIDLDGNWVFYVAGD
jgi:hypothetical protein